MYSLRGSPPSYLIVFLAGLGQGLLELVDAHCGLFPLLLQKVLHLVFIISCYCFFQDEQLEKNEKTLPLTPSLENGLKLIATDPWMIRDAKLKQS